jgi:hypothetical protein
MCTVSRFIISSVKIHTFIIFLLEIQNHMYRSISIISAGKPHICIKPQYFGHALEAGTKCTRMDGILNIFSP